jgi:3-hydroxyacyl-CoA dehydrogenase
MAFNIRKAAVIGSGTMGGGIAALLAGVGIPTVLLDVPARDTQPGDSPVKRNAVVNEGLKRLQTSRPPQPLSAADVSLIRTGNIDDNLDLLADADWVIEVVIEKLDVKQTLMAKLAEVVGANAIISTNTSGLPIKAIAEGLGENFTRRFLGTHFFNPPRYLHLLEVIPHENTDPAVIDYMVRFGTRVLGKGVVLCKDEPNFIGNRFMSMVGSQIVNYALDNGFTVDEVDSLTGPLIGRPKTATFRLNDLVGVDIAVHVARNLYPAIPDDPAREVLHHPNADALFDRLMSNNWLGNKTGQGFYKMMKGADGAKEFWTLNLDTFEYQAPTKPRFDSVGAHRKVEDTGERIRLLMGEDDRAAKLLWHHHAFYLAYASNRVPEITETIVNIDSAQKWGFSHELGPFEIWDAIGVAATVPQFEEAGYPVADWVKQMLASGLSTFYQRDEAGQVIGYYSPQAGEYVPLDEDKRAITAAGLRANKTAKGEVARNSGASVLDMGDGVALLEFHSPAQAVDTDVLDITWKALDLLQSDFDALVIGNDAERFSVGANLLMMAMAAQAGQFDDINGMLNRSQEVMQQLRYAPKPVVVAPHNLALGGGAEFAMAGARTVAYIELYIGLVELGVGLIPASGGCKEMLRRVLNPVMESSANADPLPHLQKVFEMIATAKVSGSAKEAHEMGFLSACDRIVMNREHLLGEAKREALHMADGYLPARSGKVWAAGRDAYAALLIGIEGFRESGFASEYDAVLARKLAYVLTGGAVSEPRWVDEQVILDLEREAFLSLLREPKTIERIAFMLQNNKPLRN